MEIVAKKVEIIKIWLAVGLTVFGCLLIVAGFFANPIGELHNSILIVVGEIFSFSGTIFGINMAYQSKLKNLEKQLNEKDKGGN